MHKILKIQAPTKKLSKLVKEYCSKVPCDLSPLSGVTVVDLTRIVAGPYCTMLLGDLGAEIIKVEHPTGGDEARKWGPPFIGDSQESCYFASLNRNKKSICVDVKTEQGKKIICDLVKRSDILIENYIPGKLHEFGIGYEDLQPIAPHLIYCSITGYGPDGPYASRPGYDVIAAGYGGLLSFTGEENGDPVKVGVAMTDIATGLFAYGSIMAALLLRNRTGEGQKIDCSLLGSQVASLINLGSNYINCGKIPIRRGTAHESIVPYQAFKTANGHLIVGTGSDKQFQALCSLLHIPHVAQDEKYCSNTQRVHNRKELIKLLQSIFVSKSTHDWMKTFESSPFPYGPVNTLDEVFADPHVEHLNMVTEMEHPTARKVKVVGPPVKFSQGGNFVRSRPPLLGEHTNCVLKKFLNYDDQSIQHLKEIKATEPPVTVLKLRKPRTDKKVEWTNDTVDNENMNKKKSKCCCIFEKKRPIGESESEDSDDECENCAGHVERKKHHSPSPTKPS